MTDTVRTARTMPATPAALGWRRIVDTDDGHLFGYVNARGSVVLVEHENVGIMTGHYEKRYILLGAVSRKPLKTFHRFIDAHAYVEEVAAERAAHAARTRA